MIAFKFLPHSLNVFSVDRFGFRAPSAICSRQDAWPTTDRWSTRTGGRPESRLVRARSP